MLYDYLKIYFKRIYLAFAFLFLIIPGIALANTGMSHKGIYLTQSTAMNTKLVDYLIKNSKQLSNFLITFLIPSISYILKVKRNY